MRKPKEKHQKPPVSRTRDALKREIRKWYGMISVKELISNRELTLEIETLERILAHQGV